MDFSAFLTALAVQSVIFLGAQALSHARLSQKVENLQQWLRAHEERDERAHARLDTDIREVRAARGK